MFIWGVVGAGLIQAAHQNTARSSLKTDPLCSHPSLWENSQPLEAGLLMQLEDQSSLQVNSQQMNLSTTKYPSSTHNSPPCCPCIVNPQRNHSPYPRFLPSSSGSVSVGWEFSQGFAGIHESVLQRRHKPKQESQSSPSPSGQPPHLTDGATGGMELCQEGNSDNWNH